MESRIRALAEEFEFDVHFEDGLIEGTDFLRVLEISRDDTKLKDVERKRSGKVLFTPAGLIRAMCLKNSKLTTAMLESLWTIPDENDLISEALARADEVTQKAEEMEKLASTFAKYVRITNKMTVELEQAAAELDTEIYDEEDEVKRHARSAKIKYQSLLLSHKKNIKPPKPIVNVDLPAFSLVRDPQLNGPCYSWSILRELCYKEHREASKLYEEGKIPLDKFSYNSVWVQTLEITEKQANLLELVLDFNFLTIDQVQLLLDLIIDSN